MAKSGRSLTYDPTLLDGIQDPLAVDTLLKVVLCCNAKLVIFQGYLSNELEVAFEFFFFTVIVVVELHPRNPRTWSGASTKGGYPAAIDLTAGV